MDEATLRLAPVQSVFSIDGVNLVAKRWGKPGGIPVIALHGWLDNCASFDFLAPLLAKGCDIVCLDCAGHGKSGHRPHLGAYNIWQDVIELFAVADQLGWRDFSLLGHSRGAMIAFLAAGTLPQRITNLMLIEGIQPRTALSEQAPQILADAIAMLKKANSSQSRQYYDTFAEAVDARVKGVFPISLADAEALAIHGVIESEQGFRWHFDRKLMAGSEVRFSLDQIEAFKTRISAQALLIIAEQGFITEDTSVLRWIETIPRLAVVWLSGGHHLHMSESADSVAQVISTHLGLTSRVQ